MHPLEGRGSKKRVGKLPSGQPNAHNAGAAKAVTAIGLGKKGAKVWSHNSFELRQINWASAWALGTSAIPSLPKVRPGDPADEMAQRSRLSESRISAELP
jgi:hypothetical protein